MPHNCSNKTCSSVLVKTDNYALSALSLSPLTSYQFVVAGEAEYVSVMKPSENDMVGECDVTFRDSYTIEGI
jgi:hypothetical protein